MRVFTLTLKMDFSSLPVGIRRDYNTLIGKIKKEKNVSEIFATLLVQLKEDGEASIPNKDDFLHFQEEYFPLVSIKEESEVVGTGYYDTGIVIKKTYTFEDGTLIIVRGNGGWTINYEIPMKMECSSPDRSPSGDSNGISKGIIEDRIDVKSSIKSMDKLPKKSVKKFYDSLLTKKGRDSTLDGEKVLSFLWYLIVNNVTQTSSSSKE